MRDALGERRGAPTVGAAAAGAAPAAVATLRIDEGLARVLRVKQPPLERAEPVVVRALQGERHKVQARRQRVPVPNDVVREGVLLAPRVAQRGARDAHAGGCRPLRGVDLAARAALRVDAHLVRVRARVRLGLEPRLFRHEARHLIDRAVLGGDDLAGGALGLRVVPPARSAKPGWEAGEPGDPKRDQGAQAATEDQQVVRRHLLLERFAWLGRSGSVVLEVGERRHWHCSGLARGANTSSALGKPCPCHAHAWPHQTQGWKLEPEKSRSCVLSEKVFRNALTSPFARTAWAILHTYQCAIHAFCRASGPCEEHLPAVHTVWPSAAPSISTQLIRSPLDRALTCHLTCADRHGGRWSWWVWQRLRRGRRRQGQGQGQGRQGQGEGKGQGKGQGRGEGGRCHTLLADADANADRELQTQTQTQA
eukprot:scaffold46485_cov67-Phaeocystis_antarctica.AAC.1